MSRLWLLTAVTIKAEQFPQYLNMTEKEQLDFSLQQRDFFESTGRLPKTEIFENGKRIYSPNQWVDRPSLTETDFFESSAQEVISPRLRNLQESVAVVSVTCPDGTTVCDSTTSTCAGCYCSVFPYSETVYGVTREGGNVNCVWSNCYCLNLLR